MIHKEFFKVFKEPNFQVTAVDSQDRKYVWLTYCETKELLMEKLDEMYSNIRVKEYNFNDWRSRASIASTKAIVLVSEGKTPVFDSTIWGDLKTYLFELFSGKCAYCESSVCHISPGDVEHYRPKRKIAEDGQHKGYYWLAYEPQNLLPVCEECNEARGKLTHFPINGIRACCPNDDLDAEERLLLMPYLDYPRNELYFQPIPKGVPIDELKDTVKGLTKRGEASTKIYHLNRRELVRRRAQAQKNIEDSLGLLLIKDLDKLQELWRQMYDGEIEYSSAALAQAEYWWNELNQRKLSAKGNHRLC